jgi:tetratricopeptide (TPR) repeat protein
VKGQDAGRTGKLPPLVSDILLARGLKTNQEGPPPPLVDWLALPGVQRRAADLLRRRANASTQEQPFAERTIASIQQDLRLWFDGQAPQEVSKVVVIDQAVERVGGGVTGAGPTRLFILDLETDTAARCVTLRLHHEDGRFVAAHEVALDAHPASRWAALFDTQWHVRRMKDVEPPEAQLAALGRFLGEHVLGPGIVGALAEGVTPRTVLIRLPNAMHDLLAAAFAQVPWELARAPGDDRTLLARNVVVRAALSGVVPGREMAVTAEAGRPVRVLLVFTEAPGSRPLAVRLERERLLDLFFAEVLPKRNVEVDVLCHGVTRRRLTDQVRSRSGYHVVHWSGHGNMDALAIALDEGEKGKARISGKELAALLSGADGFIPSVVFLSTGQSGSLVTTENLAALRESLGGKVGGLRRGDAAPVLDAMIKERVGFTTPAFELVNAGVKQVVAMRYDVGDRYARRLARLFYRQLLAGPLHYPVDAALALARTELALDQRREVEYAPLDHASPLVFGGDSVRIEPAARRSAQMDRRAPRPQPLLQSGGKDLDPPYGFVGRDAELTELALKWLDREGAPVALIQGLAGLGKTSLAAEAIHLWFDRFDYVFCFQAKGGALSTEEFYRRLDQRLTLTSRAYRERCRNDETARVFIASGPAFMGEPREEKLQDNLVKALRSERILLVLDHFDTNLLMRGGPEYTSQDPAWDALLKALDDKLRGARSRVLVTSRHKLAALAKHSLWIPLGPLPWAEAQFFFEGQTPIRGLLRGDDVDKRLAWRILNVSRGHPLILARIADLARGYYDKTYGLTPAGRKALAEALDKLQGDGYRALPDVFVGAKTEKEREQERRYLEDVAVGAVDLLIERLSAEARTLLWVVTRAGEPTVQAMIQVVWGESPQARLGELCGSGLLVRDGNAYAFHELVAERAAAWMEKHPDERGGRTEAGVWELYGVYYGEAFKAAIENAKRDLASEMGRRGIRYLVRARAFERLGAFASEVVIGTRDPALLGQVIGDLQAAAGEVPAGEARWSLRTYLADALRMAGRPDQALPLYAQAAEEAEAAEHWAHLGWIYGNWANALVMVGQLDRAREAHVKSAEAEGRAGRPRVNVVVSELEALRVDVMQGRAKEALPVIEAKLDEVRGWWALRQQGKPVREAPEGEMLARALVGGLAIAFQVNLALERWQPCLDLLGELEEVNRALGAGEHETAGTRFNRYRPLMRLGKLAEAKAVLEGCLDVFHRVEDVTNEARALSALADVWNALGDPVQAVALERRALAVCERLPDPGDRATSHNNLASYLYAAGATGEARAHQLADLAYTLATGLDPRISLKHLALRIRQSAARGETFAFSPLAELLIVPAFAPLRAFLAQREVSVDQLRTAIDDLVAQVRAAVAAQPPAA